MIAIDLTKAGLTPTELKVVAPVLTRAGTLRTSRPVLSLNRGATAYVWRMLAFYTSNKRPHNCLPVTAGFWVEERYIKPLDQLVDKVLTAIPLEQLHGVKGWLMALDGRSSPTNKEKVS